MADLAKQLQGQIAIASAKIAYQIFNEIFNSDRFKKLTDKRRPSSTTTLGKYQHKKSRLQRCKICRSIDWASDCQYAAT